MNNYLELLQDVRNNGEFRSDRTGVGRYSVFGRQLRFPLDQGFPLVTTKRVPFRLILTELLWLLRGQTNIRFLLDHNVHIWDEWTPAYESGGEDGVLQAYEQGQFDQLELGPVYGAQWRAWPTRDGGTIDQIAQVIDQIKDVWDNPNSPYGSRLIVNAWNPEDVPSMALPPCHMMFQFRVSPKGTLDCQLYQRSADLFLGVPFNIASYSLLTMMVAQVTDLRVGDFVHTFGDAHIYSNHLDQVDEQLGRTPRQLPRVVLNPGVKEIENFDFDDVSLEGYNSHPTIKAPVAR